MEDTLHDEKTLVDPVPVDETRRLAQALGELIRDHRGLDVVILDMRESAGWTDFFIIATVTSSTHTQGLLRYIKEFARNQGMEILRNHRKATEDSWHYVDFGTMVVHLMTEASRSFYELERLWSAAPQIKIPVE